MKHEYSIRKVTSGISIVSVGFMNQKRGSLTLKTSPEVVFDVRNESTLENCLLWCLGDKNIVRSKHRSLSAARRTTPLSGVVQVQILKNLKFLRKGSTRKYFYFYF